MQIGSKLSLPATLYSEDVQLALLGHPAAQQTQTQHLSLSISLLQREGCAKANPTPPVSPAFASLITAYPGPKETQLYLWLSS